MPSAVVAGLRVRPVFAQPGTETRPWVPLPIGPRPARPRRSRRPLVGLSKLDGTNAGGGG